MTIKIKSTRRYRMNALPPRTYWQMPVSLTRAEAVGLCEELNYAVSEFGGVIFTYPDEAKDEVACRFEFHEKLGDKKAEIRLGLMITVSQSDVTAIEVYISTPALIEGTQHEPNFRSCPSAWCKSTARRELRCAVLSELQRTAE